MGQMGPLAPAMHEELHNELKTGPVEPKTGASSGFHSGLSAGRTLGAFQKSSTGILNFRMGF